LSKKIDGRNDRSRTDRGEISERKLVEAAASEAKLRADPWGVEDDHGVVEAAGIEPVCTLNTN
jgi:hypothetical protein